MRYATALVLALLALGISIVQAEDRSSGVDQFVELEKRISGRIGVAAVDIAKNKQIEYHADQRFLMCSTFKVLAVAAILKRVDEKKEQLDRFVRYGEAQLLEYAPVTRAHVTEGGMILEALCAAAVSQSDNTAANLLLEAIDGPKGWTEFARNLGDNSSRLDRMEPELNLAAPGDDRDTTTPAAMCENLQRLLASEVLSKESRARLEGWMVANETGAKMIRASVARDWRVGDKTGRGKEAANDIAIVRPPNGGPFFLAIYVNAPSESSEARDNLVAAVAKIAIDALTKPNP